MEKEFIPYELAVALKELGFDEPCIGYATIEYKDVVHCGISFKIHKETDLPTKPFGVPLYQQAFRWFRDTYDLKFLIEWDYDHYNAVVLRVLLKKFNTYEEAELECLKNLIEIVKNQKL
jgi:hypothetical protein